MKHTEKAVDYKQLDVSSSAFNANGSIPEKYTCDGKNIHPPLNIKNIPQGAKCLALIADDPDAPSGTWVHWIVWNIPVTHYIKENEVHGVHGLNDFGKRMYQGPCPPAGAHRYLFKVYALDELMNLPTETKKHLLERAMSGHILAFGELTGLYTRKKQPK